MSKGDDRALLSCPFCDGDCSVLGLAARFVTCHNCGANSGNHSTEATAIEAWNRRQARGQQEPLTDEQIENIAIEFMYGDNSEVDWSHWLKFALIPYARAIEREVKHG